MGEIPRKILQNTRHMLLLITLERLWPCLRSVDRGIWDHPLWQSWGEAASYQQLEEAQSAYCHDEARRRQDNTLGRTRQTKPRFQWISLEKVVPSVIRFLCHWPNEPIQNPLWNVDGLHLPTKLCGWPLHSRLSTTTVQQRVCESHVGLVHVRYLCRYVANPIHGL